MNKILGPSGTVVAAIVISSSVRWKIYFMRDYASLVKIAREILYRS
ncbi:MAG: hypothetical protein ACREBI_00360 [Nitrosotalea sp.]